MSGHLLALMGAPGAGKSTLASTYGGAEVIDLDVFRERRDAPGGYIIAAKLKKAERLLLAGRTVVFDSCLAHAGMRTRLLRLAARANATTRLVYVNTSLGECLKANEHRSSPVPEQKVRDLHMRTERAWRSVPNEGWDAYERANVHATSVDGSRQW